MMILNQKSLKLREYEELNFEDEEEKKLFLLTRYNTLINKSPPDDIEKAANKSILKNNLIKFNYCFLLVIYIFKFIMRFMDLLLQKSKI